MDKVSRMRSYVSYYTFFAFVRAQADNDNFVAYLKTWYSADRTIRSHTLYAGKQNAATAAKPAGKEKLENLHDLSRKKIGHGVKSELHAGDESCEWSPGAFNRFTIVSRLAAVVISPLSRAILESSVIA